MNKGIAYLLLIASLHACNNETIIRENKYPNGKLKSKIVKDKNEARYFSYYESGAIESEGYVDRGLLRQREWKYFDVNGSVNAEGRYSDDLRVDEWKYRTTDTSFSIYWEKYIDRPVSLNIPKGWIIYDNQKEPGLFLAVDDSINTRLGINISRTEKEGESIDTMVTRGNTYFSKLYPQSKQYISEAVLNSRKAIKVMLTGRTSDGKDLKTCRYYLEAGNYFYLLAFFSTVHDQELLYNKVAEEAALSFKITE